MLMNDNKKELLLQFRSYARSVFTLDDVIVGGAVLVGTLVATQGNVSAAFALGGAGMGVNMLADIIKERWGSRFFPQPS